MCRCMRRSRSRDRGWKFPRAAWRNGQTPHNARPGEPGCPAYRNRLWCACKLTAELYYHIMQPDPRVVVVLPAYNAAKTLEKTYADIPKDIVSKIILVDDVSQDKTVDVARALGLSVVIHIQNRGYGGNQKTCYLEALKLGADIVVMLHPDHQYDSRLIPQLVQPIIDQQADMVIGSRILNGMALKGGMPLWKFVSNRVLTIADNIT